MDVATRRNRMNARQKAKRMKSRMAVLESENRSLRFRLAFAQANKPDVQLYRAKIMITPKDMEMMESVGLNPWDKIRNRLSEEIRKGIKDKLIIKEIPFDGYVPGSGTSVYSTDLLIGFRRDGDV